MNMIIFKILLSIVSGICLGLYLKNIAFFIYIAIAIIGVILISSEKYRKYFSMPNIFVFVFSIVIFLCTYYVDNKYENLYSQVDECYGIGEIVSFAEEKTYTNKYIIKIKSIRRFEQI